MPCTKLSPTDLLIYHPYLQKKKRVSIFIKYFYSFDVRKPIFMVYLFDNSFADLFHCFILLPGRSFNRSIKFCLFLLFENFPERHKILFKLGLKNSKAKGKLNLKGL